MLEQREINTWVMYVKMKVGKKLVILNDYAPPALETEDRGCVWTGLGERIESFQMGEFIVRGDENARVGNVCIEEVTVSPGMLEPERK